MTSSRTCVLTSVATSLERTACGSSGVGFASSSHLACTILSPSLRASAIEITVLTSNRSTLSISRWRPCRTFSGSSGSPDFVPYTVCVGASTTTAVLPASGRGCSPPGSQPGAVGVSPLARSRISGPGVSAQR